MEIVILAVDPGRSKIGAAVLSSVRGVLRQEIFKTDGFISELKELMNIYRPSALILGDKTGSKLIKKTIEDEWPGHPPVKLIDEHLSSEEGRRLYLLDHPGRGLRRFIPLCLKTPDSPYDDYVAVVLGRRYFEKIGIIC